MPDFESGHWYEVVHGVARLVESVPYADKKRAANGESRAPTLRDARKYRWWPSVTTALQVVDKPGLDTWKLDWALDLALLKPWLTRAELKEEAGEYVEWAAAQGSKIHLGLSEHFHGRTIEIEPEVDEVVAQFWPWYRLSGLRVQRSEYAVVAPAGYCGTIDYVGTYYRRPCIADFKTQDFERPSGAQFYDTHPLQLAGYDDALPPDPDRAWLSVVLSRQVPGLVVMHDWTPEKERWRSAWRNLWAFWQDLKNYYPLREYDPDNPG